MQTVTNYEWNVIFHVCNFVTEKFIRVDGDQINVYPTQGKLLVSGVYSTYWVLISSSESVAGLRRKRWICIS